MNTQWREQRDSLSTKFRGDKHGSFHDRATHARKTTMMRLKFHQRVSTRSEQETRRFLAIAMLQKLDFVECLKDSPFFRYQIEQNEQDITKLESELEKIIKVCNTVVEVGKSYGNAVSGLIKGVQSLCTYFNGDTVVTESLEKFGNVLDEALSYFMILMDQTQCSIANALQKFLKEEIKKVKETKKVFDKMSYDLTNALVRNSQLPKNSKLTEIEEVKNLVKATNVGFDHTSLDYSFQINVLQSRKRFEILDVMLAYMHAQYTFFHQGFNLLKGVEPHMRSLGKQLEELSVLFVAEKKEMESRHQLVQDKEDSDFTISPVSSTSEIVMEGYLYKRSKNAFKTWQRRYFTIQNNQLFYQQKFKDDKTVLAEDLRLCKIRQAEDIDRRFCFELISPTKLFFLQADSQHLQTLWENAMQASIDHAFGLPIIEPDEEDTVLSGPLNIQLPATKSRSLESLDKLAMVSAEREIGDVAGNELCADCACPDPKWASINLGLVLCIECSGIHRSLGVHVSKVRSLTLDAWEPESIKVMKELGNEVVNKIFESKLDNSSIKPLPDSKREAKEEWIKAKYVDKAYFSLEKCIETVATLDQSITRALFKVPDHHHVGEGKVKVKKRLGSRRPNLKSSLLRRFSKGEKKTWEGMKLTARRKMAAEEKPAHSSATTSPELSPETQRSVSPRIGSPTRSRSPEVPKSPTRPRSPEVPKSPNRSRSPGYDSAEEQPLFAFHVSEVTDNGEATPGDFDDYPNLGSPPRAHKHLLKTKLSEVDRNSIGSCYDNILVNKQQDLTETDSSEDESDGFCGEGPGKECDVIHELDSGADDDAAAQEARAREIIKNIPGNLLLYKASEWKNLALMLIALAAGAKVSWRNDEDDMKTCLHQTVQVGYLAGSDFLLQNGAKINMRDARGRAPLHHAALLGQTGVACLLLKKGANQHAIDESGQDPLMIALGQMHADIVTLLRLARLNDEMKESNDNVEKLGDHTYTDVVRDFSNIASMNPERLQRKYDPDRHTNV